MRRAPVRPLVVQARSRAGARGRERARALAEFVVTSPRTLYRYALTAPIASGGSAEVYRGQLLDLGVPVAVKRFRRGPDLDPGRHFHNEYPALEGLSHPNILTSYDAFQDEGFFYLVTELATASLDQLRGTVRWSARDMVRAGTQIASALHYLHTRSSGPIVHQDVAPQNIFYFAEQGLFKLGDFNYSKPYGDAERAGVWRRGGYFAPEVADGGPATALSDLFQLGLVLYFMASGEPPVPQRLSVEEAAFQIGGGVAAARVEAVGELPAALRRCLMQLLQGDASRRYPSAAAVCAALRATGLVRNENSGA
jgi:serine/threonine protein kinase